MDGSWIWKSTWIVQVTIVLHLCAASNAQFFFLCHYNGPSHAEDNAVDHPNEIEIVVEVDTNPEFYVPGNLYKVSVMSSANFDGFMMTGLYTLSQALAKQDVGGIVPGLGVACSVVHSHVSERPKKKVSFLWIGPSAGSGCVHFMATGTLGQQVIFKDILAFRLCEYGENSDEASLAAIHEHGVILREDFENISASIEIWKSSTDVKFAEGCRYRSGMSNRAAKLCQNGPQNLTSIQLNMSTSALLQFTTAVDECANETSNTLLPGFMNVLFSFHDCRKFTIIEKIPVYSDVRTHLVSIPRLARKEDVCLRWSRVSTSTSIPTNDCWTIDNILVANTSGSPSSLAENFDPMDLANFLLFTAGKITKKCRSDGNALVFQVPRHVLRPIFATTRDIAIMSSSSNVDKLPTDYILLQQDFDGEQPLNGWLMDGGHIGHECGVIRRKKAVTFPVKSNSSRQDFTICSPSIDATSVGVLSFYLAYGRGACNASSQFSTVPIVVYAELYPAIKVHIRELPFSENAGVRRFVLPIANKFRTRTTRFCWTQRLDDKPLLKKEKVSIPPWAIDGVRLLLWQPSVTDNVLQFKINVGCLKKTPEAVRHSNSNILVEFSNDGGFSWIALHTVCLPPACHGPQVPFASTVNSVENQASWTRITYALPYASLLEPSRIRFRHVGRSETIFDWAIDDVYVGACRNGCSGHGQCVHTGCNCDPGYFGPACHQVAVSHPQTFLENFSSASVLFDSKRFQVSGGDLTYQCGILNTGKALVFNKPGPRLFQTSNLNTTQIRFLEFTVRLGVQSKKNKCLGPDEQSEGLYVHASCMGGVEWYLLKHISADGNSDPRRFSIVLPEMARGPACFFRIWQASHSGGSMDVWALDDISISADFLNRIYLNFTDEDRVRGSLAQYSGVIGTYCNSKRTLKVGEPSDGFEVQQIVTKAISVGPSYMLQFELVHQCPSRNVNPDSKVDLEFSTDHGVTWRLVNDACLPPADHCNAFYTQGTVYFASEFKYWKRVTIALPQNTWSPVTRFRFVQRLRAIDAVGGDASWALDNLYIGPKCSDLCSGHGLCVDGVCRCDKGFHGPSCLPVEKLPVVFDRKIASQNEFRKSGFEITGGRLLPEEKQKAFGIVASGSTFYFSENGVRQLVTPDMHTNDTEYLQFFLGIGNVENENFVNRSLFIASNPFTLVGLGESECSATYAIYSGPGVLFQFSNDAGNTWHLLKQFFQKDEWPHLQYISLPQLARTGCTRMRWWQPLIASNGERHPWTLEEIKFSPEFYATSETIVSNTLRVFQEKTAINDEIGHNDKPSAWSFHTSSTRRNFCMSVDEVEVFDGVELNRFAITREMLLTDGDVIQFQISIGCTDTFSSASQVHLEYSHDHGMSWTFVQDECYPTSSSCGVFREATIYYAGTHGHWRTIVLPVSKEISSKKVSFRWSQRRILNRSKSDGAFALNDVYVGRPCPNWCSGRGRCIMQRCACFAGFEGPYCSPLKVHPTKFADKFDAVGVQGSGPLWQSVYGGWLGTGCGTLGMGNSLYFGGHGTREAATISLDTRRINKVKFLMRLGWMNGMKSTCHLPRESNESITVQYSTNNGLSWQTLLYFDKEAFAGATREGGEVPARSFSVELPKEARTPATNFVWWQPLWPAWDRLNESVADVRAPWALDNVAFAAEDVPHPSGFFATFEVVETDNWYMTFNGTVGPYCFGDKNVLFFKDTKAVDYQQFAETEDFAVSAVTFLQFDLAINCQRNFFTKRDSNEVASFYVELNYSIDAGHSWNLLEDGCSSFPHARCSQQHSSGRFLVDIYGGQWTRVTMPLPLQAMSPSTRFRWKKVSSSSSQSLGWAIDNVYVGHDCPWMCSGHGRCLNRSCICDDEFEGDYCVPAVRRPREFRDDFDGNQAVINTELWPEIYGATLKSSGRTSCGVVVSGSALNFDGEGLRMAVIRDLDLTDVAYIQFALKLPCRYGAEAPSLKTPSQSVLIQYSNNGGITWQTLKEITSYASDDLSRHVVPLRSFAAARTNCTRIRFWQPRVQETLHSELSDNVWALDSVLVGGSLLATPGVLYDTFDDDDAGPQLDAWLDWPGGHIGNLCNSSNKRRALVFSEKYGEKATYTRDVRVDSESVIQFDIKVGCGPRSTNRYPVRLEFSSDLSRMWKSVSGNHHKTFFENGDVDDLRTTLVSSVIYANAEDDWRRVVLPLDSLGISGTVRFRWIQGYFTYMTGDVESSEWGLDNVYVGPSCPNHCSGHGWCLNGVICQCDAFRDGVNCERLLRSNPEFVKENFEIKSMLFDNDADFTPTTMKTLRSSSNIWKSVSGAEVSTACGMLITGTSLVFNQLGSRHLVSRELNLTSTRTLQFYLRIGCVDSDVKRHSKTSRSKRDVFLHYSVDGGIFWTLLDWYDLMSNSMTTAFVSLELPDEMRTESTALRWSQSSVDGTFDVDWAIDQIYIGVENYGLLTLNDGFRNSKESDANWLLTPGGILQSICGGTYRMLHFAGANEDRFAMTIDMALTDHNSFIQFEILMGCKEGLLCYSVEFEYSLDAGKSWHLVLERCLPDGSTGCSAPQDGSVYYSDVHVGRNLISLELPHYIVSRATRFRWIQKRPFQTGHSWALGAVYIGRECSSACGGRGRCIRGECECEDGWTGNVCDVPKEPLSASFREEFSAVGMTSSKFWNRIKGGVISDLCDTLGRGSAMHFYGGCSRLLETALLDLRNVTDVRFIFKFGCITRPSGNHQSVVFQYSDDNGMKWFTLRTLNYDQYKNKRSVVIALPSRVRRNGVSLRWWQAGHGGRAQGDWALDDVVIDSRPAAPPEIFVADFINDSSELSTNIGRWAYTNNVQLITSYCGSKVSMAVGEVVNGAQDAVLETEDILTSAGHVLEFSLMIGCNVTDTEFLIPAVHLQYSLDGSATWRPVWEECLPDNATGECADQSAERPASIYDARLRTDWKSASSRTTIPLSGKLTSTIVRFRWIQFAAEHSGSFRDSVKWGLRDVYVGPGCDHLCYGHGSSRAYPRCTCDDDFLGGECEIQRKGLPNRLRDSFDDAQLNLNRWRLFLGSVFEGGKIVLNGCGLRLLETVDLDLQDAKFVFYVAAAKHFTKATLCPSRKLNLHLQYSTDGGITWSHLHELVHSLYLTAKSDYLILPRESRTTSTRLRWWQSRQVHGCFLPIHEGSIGMAWIIDEVLIGGSDINPDNLRADFDDEHLSDDFWFASQGNISSGFCNHIGGPALVWKKSHTGSLITRELIVGENYILRFKIVVGCGVPHSCDNDLAIILEFRTNPHSAYQWRPVRSRCFPTNASSEPGCLPGVYHEGTIYASEVFGEWTQVIVELPEMTFSSATQFRWKPQRDDGIINLNWAIDDVHIGEACFDDCSRATTMQDCVSGHDDDFCETGLRSIQPSIGVYDDFDIPVTSYLYRKWTKIIGAQMSTIGCGSLTPWGRDKRLLFGGCASRQIITSRLNLQSASKLIFVLKSCNVNLTSFVAAENKGMLLQYSVNRGRAWTLVASHQLQDFLKPRRVVYDLPQSARRASEVQLRWWQPDHRGPNVDQWALDSLEFIVGESYD